MSTIDLVVTVQTAQAPGVNMIMMVISYYLYENGEVCV